MVPAFFNYRYQGYYDVWLGNLVIPREEEEGTFDCDDGGAYGWYDDDANYFEVAIFRGDDTEWTGDYPSYYDSDCEVGEYYDYSETHCFGTIDGSDPEGFAADAGTLSIQVASWTEAEVTGRVDYGNDLSERFSATNCGEVGSYYYENRSQRAALPEEAGDLVQRPSGRSWSLRFR